MVSPCCKKMVMSVIPQYRPINAVRRRALDLGKHLGQPLWGAVDGLRIADVDAGMEYQDQPQLGYPFIEGQQPVVIHIKILIVGMQLDAHQPQFSNPLQLLQCVRGKGMDGTKGDDAVVVDLLRPIVDNLLLAGLGCNVEDHAVIHARFLLLAQDILDAAIGMGPHAPRVFDEGLHSPLYDLVIKCMCMKINDHRFT